MANALVGLTTTGTNVFVNPMYLISTAELPALRIFVARDQEVVNGDQAQMGDITWRQLAVDVEAVARTSATDTTLADVLDTICAEVETAVMTDSTLAGLVVDVQLASTTIEVDDEAEEPTGTATMAWLVTYRTDGTAPTTVA
jgi:hypothetical protein